MALSSFNRILFLLIILMLSACAGTNVKSPTPDEAQANDVDNPYKAGKLASDAGDYQVAIRHFRSAELSDSSDDKLKQQAMLELSYTYFKVSDYYSAVAAANRFIQNFPASPHSDYAYYLKALAYYEQAIQLLDTPAEVNDPAAMQAPMAQLCIQAFEELKVLFPNSRYSADGAKRLEHIHDRLADRDMLQAEQYFEQGDFANAALYAKQVIETYPDSNYMLQATSLLSRSYQQIGLPQEAKAPVSLMELVSAPVPVPVPVIQPIKAEVSVALNTPVEAVVPEPEPVIPSPVLESTSQLPLISDGEPWIAAQQRDHYTIQIMSSSDESSMKAFMKKQGLVDTTVYYRVDHKGGDLYRLLYGAFDSLGEAKAGVATLPSAAARNQPWIRSFASVQAQLSVDAE